MVPHNYQKNGNEIHKFMGGEDNSTTVGPTVVELRRTTRNKNLKTERGRFGQTITRDVLQLDLGLGDDFPKKHKKLKKYGV